MIIGITGTNGAGKGTVVEYLKQKGFAHGSVRTVLVKEVLRRGMEVNRTSMMQVGNDLRARHGSGWVVEQLYTEASTVSSNVVIESVRTAGEASYLKSKGALLWAVDADKRVRYERVSKRWSETDRLPFEQFVAEEEREFFNQDPTKQSLGSVIALADEVLTNDATPEELYQQVNLALKKAGVQ